MDKTDTSILRLNSRHKEESFRRTVTEDDTQQRAMQNPYQVNREKKSKTETAIDSIGEVKGKEGQQLFLKSKNILRKQRPMIKNRDNMFTRKLCMPSSRIVQTEKIMPVTAKRGRDTNFVRSKHSSPLRDPLVPTVKEFSLSAETGQQQLSCSILQNIYIGKPMVMSRSQGVRSSNVQQLVANLNTMRVPSRVLRYNSDEKLQPLSGRSDSRSKTPGKSPLVSKLRRARSLSRSESIDSTTPESNPNDIDNLTSNLGYLQIPKNIFAR